MSAYVAVDAAPPALYRAFDAVPGPAIAEATTPPPAWYGVVDRWTARLAGRDFGTRLAGGEAQLPTLRPAALRLSQAGKERLAGTVLFLVPGGTWPGVGANGAAWLAPWAQTLRRLGVGRVVPVPLLEGRDPISATFEPLVSRATGHHQDHVARVVAAELAARPAGPGGVWLLGHSYGSLVAFEAAHRLKHMQRLPVTGAVALETHLASTGFFVRRAPALDAVVVAENEDGYWPAALAGTRYTRVPVPGLAHMDLVLRPPARLVAAIVRAIAGEENP